jgi:hypothetical protein
MNALSNTITDGNGQKIIGLAPPCAMTGPYQGLSDIALSVVLRSHVVELEEDSVALLHHMVIERLG